MPEPAYVLAAVLVATAMTLFSRMLPFVLLRRIGDSSLVEHLASAMPLGVMVILVCYTLARTNPTVPPYGVPEVLALGLTLGLHLWRGNALLSLIAGTGAYVAMVALV